MTGGITQVVIYITGGFDDGGHGTRFQVELGDVGPIGVGEVGEDEDVFGVVFDAAEDAAEAGINFVVGGSLGVAGSEDDGVLAVAIYRVEGEGFFAVVVDAEEEAIVIGPTGLAGLAVLKIGEEFFGAFLQIDDGKVHPMFVRDEAGDVFAVGGKDE